MRDHVFGVNSPFRFCLSVGERECSGGWSGASSEMEPAAKRRAAKLQTEVERGLRFDQAVRDERDRNETIRARFAVRSDLAAVFLPPDESDWA